MPPPENYNLTFNFSGATMQAIEEEEGVDSPNDKLYMAYHPIKNGVKTEISHGSLEKNYERLLVKKLI